MSPYSCENASRPPVYARPKVLTILHSTPLKSRAKHPHDPLSTQNRLKLMETGTKPRSTGSLLKDILYRVFSAKSFSSPQRKQRDASKETARPPKRSRRSKPPDKRFFLNSLVGKPRLESLLCLRGLESLIKIR